MTYGRRAAWEEVVDDDVRPSLDLATTDTTSDALVRVIEGGSCRSGNSFDVYFSILPPRPAPPLDELASDDGGGDDDGGCSAPTEEDRRIIVVVAASAVAVVVDG